MHLTTTTVVQIVLQKKIIFVLLSIDKKCSRLRQSQAKQIQKSYRRFCSKQRMIITKSKQLTAKTIQPTLQFWV